MPYDEDEFRVLRHTIALRGTTRIVLLPLTVSVWSLLAAGLLTFSEVPLHVVFPLGILVAGFESIHALHVGVERIGRYIQVYYEGAVGGPQWETTATAVGPSLPGGGTDPLFTAVFVGATVVNATSAWALRPPTIELTLILSAHLAFLVRLVRARVAAARQRAVELESYRALRAGMGQP